jgi:hypothetical protein
MSYPIIKLVSLLWGAAALGAAVLPFVLVGWLNRQQELLRTLVSLGIGPDQISWAIGIVSILLVIRFLFYSQVIRLVHQMADDLEKIREIAENGRN